MTTLYIMHNIYNIYNTKNTERLHTRPHTDAYKMASTGKPFNLHAITIGDYNVKKIFCYILFYYIVSHMLFRDGLISNI